MQEDEHDQEDEDDEQVWQPNGDEAGAHSDLEADSDTEVANALTDVNGPEPTSWFGRVWRALRGVKPDPTGVRLWMACARLIVLRASDCSNGYLRRR